MNDMTPPGELDKLKKRAIVLRNVALTLLIAYMIVVTVALLYNGYTGSATRKTLIDCVEPTGDCFKQGQARTGQAVQQLIDANKLDEVATRRIVIISVTCQQLPGIDTLSEIQECVNAQLKLDKEKEED